jgi:hypothetical protein
VTAPDRHAGVRYLVTDVQAAIDFYTTHLGFTLNSHPGSAFADVVRGPLRLLLSGPASSGARATPDDAAAAGRNRIHLVVDDLDAEIGRLRSSAPADARSSSRIPMATWSSSSRPPDRPLRDRADVSPSARAEETEGRRISAAPASA